MEQFNLTVRCEYLSWHVVWIAAIFEGLSVMLATMCMGSAHAAFEKTVWIGFLLGYFGLFILLFLLNLFFKFKQVTIDIYTLTGLRRIYLTAIFGCIFLSSMFAVQNIVMSLFAVNLFLIAMNGFVSTFLAFFITLLVYNINFPSDIFKLHVVTKANHTFVLSKVSVLSMSLLAGVYELFALPIIHCWTLLSLPAWLSGLVVGLVAGAVGIIAVILLFNFLISKHLKLKFIFINR
jgi:hypothetical protein